MKAIPEVEEQKSKCPCCGRNQFSSCGSIEDGDEVVAGYWYRWVDGHEGHFSLAIQWYNSDVGMRVATVSAQANPEELKYSVLEKPESSFGDLSEYGEHLGRDATLSQSDITDFWQYVDVLAHTEPMLSAHLKSHYGLA